MDRTKIAIYPALKENFFNLEYRINCRARGYVSCTNVDKYFDFGKVDAQQLVDIGMGIKVSKPVLVEPGLKNGCSIFCSISHKGVLAIHGEESGSFVQLTDLGRGLQVEVSVESWTHTGFYDDSMIILTFKMPLRVCLVEQMFSGGDMSSLRAFGDLRVFPWTDVSVIQSTRVLYFVSMVADPYEFDLDTETIRHLDIGKHIWAFGSVTGIDIGVRGIFEEDGNNNFTYALNRDNTTPAVLECCSGFFPAAIIPSVDQENIEKGMKIFSNGVFFVGARQGKELVAPFTFQDWHSILRLYQDIFLVYDENTKRWCLVKILVP